MSASKVTDTLWIGGAPSVGPALGQEFDRLVLAAKEYQPDGELFPGLAVLQVPLPTTKLTEEETASVIQAGRAVASWMRRGKRVLVTCAVGLNRSSVIAATGLMATGMSADEAIKKVRAARGHLALHNPHFVSLLQRLQDAWSFQTVSRIM